MNMNHVVRMAGTLALAVMLAVGLWGTTPHPAYAAEGDIVIGEVMFNAYCGSANSSNTICEGGSIETQYEWVEIFNKGTASVDIQNWQICDSAGCDTITSSSTLIGPGEYWLIVTNAAAVQTELGSSGGNYGTYDASQTLLLSSSIGSNGLSNSSDAVYLKTGATGDVTDCISWASSAGSTCSSLTYVSGGGGSDTALASEANGQSITNIQGTWYYHNSAGNGYASPYGANTATGGSPTAVTFSSLRVSPNRAVLPVAALVLAGGAAAVVLARRRRR